MSSKSPKAHEVKKLGGTAEQQAYMNDIIDQFTIDTNYLNRIKEHFKKEMNKGLQNEGATVAMIPSYVEGRLTGKNGVTNDYVIRPFFLSTRLFSWTGKEEGHFLALDLGGTNLRVVLVTLLGEGKYKTVSAKSKVSDELKLGPMRNLCGNVRLEYMKQARTPN